MDPIELRLKNQIRAGEELRMQHSRSNMKQTMEEYVASIPEEQRGGSGRGCSICRAARPSRF
jgi:CO/xanthine dehydrogenase Mo-binding subunit